jgi:hypothetical protein
MSNVTASLNPIVVDNSVGETEGRTTIEYEKHPWDEFWERVAGGIWTEVNLHVRLGLGDVADRMGSFDITLKPGLSYEAAVFEKGNGPLTAHPLVECSLAVYCVWREPTDRALITEQSLDVGGTWSSHLLRTKVPTNIISIGVSRTPPTIDSTGMPHNVAPDGVPTRPLTNAIEHSVEINPLFPGNHYFFAVVVADAFGNWDVRQGQFTTLRRKITVEFLTIHIYNDGDPYDSGEGEFWFEVYLGHPSQPTKVETFHLPTQEIDDWYETDRPYPVGFTHVGSLQAVKPEKSEVWVGSRGIEHDGIFETDEGAWSKDRQLFLPVGRAEETVTNKFFTMDCPIATDGDDFHYGVDVRWSVAYLS